MTERIDSVDIAKGLGIILVIIGHSLTSDVQLRVWIYSFHIPLFFILSGIVINNDQIDSYSVTNFVQKNAKLVVNYIYFSFIYLLVDYFVRYLVLHQISLYSIAIEIYQTFILFGINVLWFIITLLLGKLLAVRILKSNMSKAQLLLTSIALFMISAMLSTLLPDRKSEMSTVVRLAYYAAVVILRVPMMSSFILLGYNFRRYIIEIENISSIKIGGGTLLLVICSCLISQFCGSIDYHYVEVAVFPIGFICAIVGTGFILGLSELLSRTRKIKKLFKFYGKHSLFIMETHEYLLIKEIVALVITVLFPDLMSDTDILIQIIGVIIVETILCVMIAPVIYKLVDDGSNRFVDLIERLSLNNN